MNNKKKLIGFIIAVIMFTALIVGATYAYLNQTVNVTNGVYNVATECFLVDYNINNTDNTQDITGTLFPSATIDKGLNGRVGLKISTSCNLNGTGTLKLHVNSGTSSTLTTPAASFCQSRSTLEPLSQYTTKEACETAKQRWMGYGDSYCENNDTLERMTEYTSSNCATNGGTWKSGGSPLKYAVYSSVDSTNPIAVGRIESTDIGNDITIKDNIMITDTQKYFYIYIWLDGYLTDNSHTELPFSGYISAEAAQNNNSVPSNYQQIEYVQSSGTQYINLKYTPTSNTNFEIKLRMIDTDTTLQRILGGYVNHTTSRYELYYSSNKFGFNYRDNTYMTVNYQTGDTPPVVVIKKTGSKISVDDQQTSTTSTTFTGDSKMYLFASSRSGTTPASVAVYYFKVYDNGNLIRDLIPCKNGNVIGMCDIASDVFYTNSGSGSFTAGPNV